MKSRQPYQFEGNEERLVKSLPEIELPFKKSKGEVWAELSAVFQDERPTIDHEISKRDRRKHFNLFISIAAVVALVLFVLTFASLYTKTVSTGFGDHLICLLPDGSNVELNAGSTIKYKPYWWQFNREVTFEGEGFFKVQKGERFDVVSAKGVTSVLGTSFNVYSRQTDYTVTCYTGRVKVLNLESGQSTEITSNQQATLLNNGAVVRSELENADDVISWKQNMFIYTAEPLENVFEEIERQYGVSIQTKSQLEFNYTGNFTKEQSVDDVMHNVCLAFGLKYKKVDDGYVVSK